MKRLLPIIFLLLFLLSPVTAHAKDYSKSLKTVEFSSLSNQDMDETIASLIRTISRDQKIIHTPVASTYEDSWAVIAHNTLLPIGDIGPTICVNLRPFKENTTDSSYQIVFTIAHEVRHSYQYEHQNDATDYGRACHEGINNYNSWYEDIGAYYGQWLEQDANEYAAKYAANYFK